MGKSSAVKRALKAKRRAINTENFHLNIQRERAIGVHPKYRNRQSRFTLGDCILFKEVYDEWTQKGAV